MGNSESNQKIPDALRNSSNFRFLAKLFEDSYTTEKGSRVVVKASFSKLFIAQNGHLSDILYEYFITEFGDQNSSSEGMSKFVFISGFDNLINLESGSQHMVEYYFKVFSEGKQELSWKDLKKVISTVIDTIFNNTTTASFATNDSLTGESTLSNSSVEVLLESLLQKEGATITRDVLVKQVYSLCPRLFNGIHSWVLRSLSKLEGSNHITLHSKKYPKIQLSTDSRGMNLLDNTALWILSVSLPLSFFKHEQDMDHEETEYFNLSWKIIYDSDEHGLSHNRFKHHCFSYRGPTVMVVQLASGGTLVLALENEWRESSKCFGGENTRLYELYPRFRLLGDKNIVLYNEKSRGLPVGLTLGNNTSQPLVSLQDGLTMAQINYSGKKEEPVQRMEVWGCAGLKAEAEQKKQQKWEKRQAEQLQKVKLPGTWDENPDKALLEMAGVTTEHAQR